jgi:hypothetical protein
LSENNNSPELVNKLFSEKAGATKVIVASRYKETPIYIIEKSPAIDIIRNNRPPGRVLQLSLF